MDEPERYKKDSMRHVKIPYGLVLMRYWRPLLGISLVWFIYDFITYPVCAFLKTKRKKGNLKSSFEVFSFAKEWGFQLPAQVLERTRNRGNR